MNYLAHAFLSMGDSHLLAGNYLADLLTKRQTEDLHPHLQQGVALHRFIDGYTDGHKEVKSCTKLFHAAVGKYAPVVVDICFDYLLNEHWSQFSTDTTFDFRKSTYRLLQEESLIPESSRARLEKMIQNDWLAHNATYYGLNKTLAHVAKRARFSTDFSDAIQVLKQNEEQMSAHFLRFFAELHRSCQEWIEDNFSITQL
ncbi:MAG: DUF479 domain-containing protein [Saprospiraceae bacterium]|nr:DUF479 domain-containing protein [Saprospiraceae bacterium]